jgi:hypothetical protein
MNQALALPEPGVLAVLNRSEIDGQLAVARQYPRNIQLYRERSRDLATINETVAAECLYSLPRDGKMIEGPSVRLAEILVANWGNCRAGARVIEEGPEYVTAQGVFHDLENNAVTTFETRRRIVDRKGRRYSGDMINMTCNAVCAIALRQAVLKGIPKPFWEDIYQAAKDRAVGDDREIPAKRKKALKAFAQYGIDEKRILGVLQLDSLEKVGREELTHLQGLYSAIKEGELTPNEAFPVANPAGAEDRGQTTLEGFAAMPKHQPRTPKPPDVESAADAHAMGREARRKNALRTQWPAQWRDQINIEAWLAGWDAENEEIASPAKDAP